MPFGDIEFNIVYGNHLQRSFRARVLAICPRKGQIEDKIRHSRYARWLIFKRTPRLQLHHHHASSLSTIPQTICPVLLVNLAVLIPDPPRFWTLYSLAGVVLPYPSWVTMRTSVFLSSFLNTSAETMWSPLPSFIPVTPAAVRPISRTSFSLKRIDCRSSVTSETSSPLPTNLAAMSESSSLRVMAMSPLRRTSLKAEASLFLATPFLVIIMRPHSPAHSSLRTASTDVIFSSCVIERKFIMDLPLVALRPSGISNILLWYTLPLSVKKRRSL